METAPPDTPAMNAARAEATDSAINRENPRYAGYQRGDPQVSQYLDNLYAKAVPIALPESEAQTFVTDLSGDEQAQAHIKIALRHEFGDSYDTVMEGMRSGTAHLFAGDEGQTALTVLADLSKLQHKGG